jgi:Esterase/lipase
MKTERIILSEDRNVTLMAYIQDVEGEFGFSKRPAIIVLPGGGYSICSDREADPVALAYMKVGYQAFVLRYSVGDKGAWPDPINDYDMAYEYIASRAEEWAIDVTKIVTVGFSAGGHLAACTATIAKNKPAASILVYPAILKDICDMCQPGMPYPNEHVDKETVPCFIVAARDDRTVNVKNSLMFELALEENGIPFESHIYSFGGHGFSTAEDCVLTNSVSERVPNWIPNSIGWLNEIMGKLTRAGFTEPNMAVSKNGNTAPILAVTCSLNHILKQNAEVQSVLEPFFDRVKQVCDKSGYTFETLCASVGDSTIRELMEMVLFTQDEVIEFDKKLHKFVNKI